MAQDIYHLPVGEIALIVSPLRGLSAAVNAPGFSALREALLRNIPLPESLSGLTPFLSEPCAAPSIPEGAAQPPFLGLITTRGCNMACRYCDFDAGRCGSDMDAELVSQSLGGWAQWVAGGNGKSLDLQFFGGEPFARFDLIEIAVHRLRFLGQKHNLTTSVEACTNGLLNGAMLGFVKDYFNAIVLSLDGQAQDQDAHRTLRNGTGTFDRVWATAQDLARSPVELCVRCCVSSLNVERMPLIAEWLCRDLRPDSITFEALKPTQESAAAGLLPPDPLLFAEGFMAARRIAQQAGVECVYASISSTPRRTLCPVGRDTFIVAPDRSVRSCYLRKSDWLAAGLDMRIGRVSEDGALLIETDAVQRLRDAVADRARCRRCFCRWSCAGGCIVIETPPGHGAAYTDYCRQTRLVHACVLLENLGMSDQADALPGDKQAVARLWEQVDDRLEVE
jgi:uncharacterized protein